MPKNTITKNGLDNYSENISYLLDSPKAKKTVFSNSDRIHNARVMQSMFNSPNFVEVNMFCGSLSFIRKEFENFVNNYVFTEDNADNADNADKVDKDNQYKANFLNQLSDSIKKFISRGTTKLNIILESSEMFDFSDIYNSELAKMLKKSKNVTFYCYTPNTVNIDYNHFTIAKDTNGVKSLLRLETDKISHSADCFVDNSDIVKILECQYNQIRSVSKQVKYFR